MSLSPLWRDVWEDVKHKGIRYWIFAGLVIVFGVFASDYLDAHYFALGPRYTAYQLIQHTKPGSPHARRIVFISIGDEEFWKGELDRRIPVKRDYLARLMTALDAADPALIALDYILRSPVADGTVVETPAYAWETKKLIDAIESIGAHRPVVLPVTFDDETSYDSKTGCYSLDSTIFRNYRFKAPKVRFGYVNIFKDVRRVPLAWPICGESRRMSSFSQAIAVTLDPNSSSAHRENGIVFGSFMPKGILLECTGRTGVGGSNGRLAGDR